MYNTKHIIFFLNYNILRWDYTQINICDYAI